jgi:hypothetical protein
MYKIRKKAAPLGYNSQKRRGNIIILDIGKIFIQIFAN